MKYKCKDCEHVFESDQTAFECPQCGGTNIVEDGNFFTKYKRPIIIVSIIIVILLLLKICSGDDGTTVNAKYDKVSQRLEVELEGEKVDQYKIIVTRNGVAMPAKEYKDKPVNFSFDVPGEYRLQVKFAGDGKMPQLSPYKKGPWNVEEPPVPKVPQIVEIKILNTDPKSKTYSVKIITNVNIVPLGETEFSIDNSTYQSSNVFTLKSGYYTFYVKNIINDSIRTSQLNLPEIVVKEPMTDTELNQLLSRIAKGDDNAVEKWKKEVEGPPAIKVSGVKFIEDTYALRQDARQMGTIYTVNSQRDSNNKILKINVIKIIVN